MYVEENEIGIIWDYSYIILQKVENLIYIYLILEDIWGRLFKRGIPIING